MPRHPNHDHTPSPPQAPPNPPAPRGPRGPGDATTSMPRHPNHDHTPPPGPRHVTRTTTEEHSTNVPGTSEIGAQWQSLIKHTRHWYPIRATSPRRGATATAAAPVPVWARHRQNQGWVVISATTKKRTIDLQKKLSATKRIEPRSHVFTGTSATSEPFTRRATSGFTSGVRIHTKCGLASYTRHVTIDY